MDQISSHQKVWPQLNASEDLIILELVKDISSYLNLKSVKGAEE